MKFFVALLFAAIALAAADVSHLNNKYLPPDHGAASSTHEHYEAAPSSFEKSSLETESFSAPAGASSFTSNQYLAPDASASFSSRSDFSSDSTSALESESSFSAPEVAASGVDTQYAADGGYVY